MRALLTASADRNSLTVSAVGFCACWQRVSRADASSVAGQAIDCCARIFVMTEKKEVVRVDDSGSEGSSGDSSGDDEPLIVQFKRNASAAAAKKDAAKPRKVRVLLVASFLPSDVDVTASRRSSSAAGCNARSALVSRPLPKAICP